MGCSVGKRFAYVLAVVALVVIGTNGAAAQTTGDPALQGRILQRSDGALFVYKDGTIYPIQTADVNDDGIAALPQAESAVGRLDQLFVQSPPSTYDTRNGPRTEQQLHDELARAGYSGPWDLASMLNAYNQAGTSPPPAAKPGDVMYQADWSTGVGSWNAGVDWKTASGMLVNDGTINWDHGQDASFAYAPFQAPSPDYAIEAEIQRLVESGSTSHFGIVFRSDQNGRYMAGFRHISAQEIGRDAKDAIVAPGDQALVQRGFGISVVDPVGRQAFDPGRDWHLYRIDVRGNQYTLRIDGRLMVDGADNRFLSGTSVGLWAFSSQINVRAFRVIAL